MRDLLKRFTAWYAPRRVSACQVGDLCPCMYGRLCWYVDLPNETEVG